MEKTYFRISFLMSTICIYHLPLKKNTVSIWINTSLAITFKRRRIVASMIQFLFSVAYYKSKVTWSKFPVIRICIWCYVHKHLWCWRLSSRSLAELWFCCLWGFWLFLYLLWLNNSETAKYFYKGLSSPTFIENKSDAKYHPLVFMRVLLTFQRLAWNL